MKKTAIGHVNCPICDFAEAEVKEDKNGHAFIFCPDCAAQTFTRNEHRDRHLRKRMRPVTVTVTVTVPEPLPADPPIPAVTNTQATANAGKPTGPGAKNPPPAVAKAPQKKAAWFQPILGAGHD